MNTSASSIFLKRTLRSSCIALALLTAAAAQNLVYTKHIGGNRTDSPGAAAVDPQGNLYLTGTTNSTNFPRTQNNPAQPALTNLLSSSNAGKTFLPIPINNPVLALATVQSALIAATTAGPYRSTDHGASWQPANLNASTNALLTDARFPTRAYAATSQGLYRSDDSGLTWNLTSLALPTNVIVSSPQRPDTIFAIADQGLYRSQDGAQTWSLAQLPISSVGPAPTVIAIDPSNTNIVYIAGAYDNTNQQAFILKSLDGGTTFTQISSLAVLTAIQAIAFDPATPTSLFAAGIDGHVYHSPDGANTWTATPLPGVTLDALAFDPYHPTNLYALTDQGLYLSPDHGSTWQPTSASVPKRDLRTIFFTPTQIFLGADAGEHVFLTKWDATGNQLWSILFGGSYFEEATALTIDPNGNPYITGITGSTDFPTTSGAFQNILNGFQNVFLARFNPDGNQLQFATYLGGSGSDSVSAMTIDSAGSVYLTGYAVSPDFPTTPNASQLRHIGACNGQAGGDVFVTKFNPTLAYSTLIGGQCAQIPTAITVDATGRAYIVGATVSPDFPVTKGVLQPLYAGNTDGFLSELTPTGDALVFSTYLGGSNADIAAGVSVDSAGNISIAGNGVGFSFLAAPPSSALQCGGTVVNYGGLSLPIASPPYLMKLPPGATAVESFHIFGACGTVVQSLAADAAGNTWLAGIADPTTFDTVSPFQTLGAGANFIRQFAPDGATTRFSTLIDSFQSLSLDTAGAAYMTAGNVTVQKIDATTLNPISIDSVQKLGTLSIPALASYSGPLGIAPGELIALNGHGFTASTQIQVDGAPATVVSVEPTVIVCAVPSSITGPRATIQPTNGNPVVVDAVPSAVEVFALVNQDGSVNSAGHPAPAGSTMTLYALGLGAATAQVIFNNPATLTYQGPAPGQIQGVTQINFVVPPVTGQSILSVVAGPSTDYVYVYVRQP